MREASMIFKALGRPEEGPGRELEATAGELIGLLASLKALGDFILLDIDAVDRPDGFHLSYRLLDRGGEGPVGVFTVKVRADRPGEGGSEPALPSAMGVWKAADVLEREVWDLMGVRFEGRSGLTRILCKDDFEGHPLRKDFLLVPSPRFADGPIGGRA